MSNYRRVFVPGGDDRLAHVAYIHNNPVKYGYCSRVDEWEISTSRRWGAMTGARRTNRKLYRTK